MLCLLATFVAQLSCQGVPILRPKLDRRFKIKSGSVALSSATRLQLILPMQPTNKRTIQLCSRNQNLFLQVNSNGIVNGTHRRNNRYCKFIFASFFLRQTLHIMQLRAFEYLNANDFFLIFKLLQQNLASLMLFVTTVHLTRARRLISHFL